MKMTEEAPSVPVPPDHELVQVRKYEAGPPPGLELVRKQIHHKFITSKSNSSLRILLCTVSVS